MTHSAVSVTRKGRVTTITLSRPEALNAITPAMHDALQAAFDAFAEDTEQFVCVVTGEGDRAFSAGSDLKAGSREAEYIYPRSGYAGIVERFDLDKPMIAAVNGLAFGGGFELALACDIIVAAEHARFALPEPKLGANAWAGGIQRLVRQMGWRPAMGYLLTGEAITAPRALQYGLINEVVPYEELQNATARWCERLLICAPLAVRATKEAALRGLDEPSLADAIRNQKYYPGHRRWWDSQDVREGVRAFGEKRRPEWKGR